MRFWSLANSFQLMHIYPEITLCPVGFAYVDRVATFLFVWNFRCVQFLTLPHYNGNSRRSCTSTTGGGSWTESGLRRMCICIPFYYLVPSSQTCLVGFWLSKTIKSCSWTVRSVTWQIILKKCLVFFACSLCISMSESGMNNIHTISN